MAKAESKTILKAYSTVESKLPTLPLEDGQLIFVYDKKKIILDNRGVRTVYEQIQTIETEEQRNDLLAPIDSFYFVIETSILWRYSNGHWNQITTSPQEQIDRIVAEGTKQVKAVQDKGTKVLQSIPEDFQTQMETKLNKQQGIENKGKALVIGEDGNVAPGEVQSGGDGIAIVNTASGESPLVIPDSAERVNKGFGLTGKTEQVQTTGAQLFDKNSVVNGVIIADGSVTDNAPLYATSDYIPVKPSVMYACTETGSKRLKFFNVDKQPVQNINFEDANVERGGTFTTGETTRFIRLSLLLEKLDSIMLNEGSKSTPHEPYTGGKPSPSPEYPKEIKNSGKWNEETQKYEVEVTINSSNLFKVTEHTTGYYVDKDGKVQINKTLGYSWAADVNNLQKQSVTLHVTTTINIKYRLFCTDLQNTILYKYTDSSTNANDNSHTFNMPDGAKKIYVSVIEINSVEQAEITLNLGNVTLPYEPYKEQTLTLTSDRPITKWDRLVEQGGEIGWLYGTKKYTVTGSENYIFGGAQYYSGISTNMYINAVKNMSGEGVCRRLKSIIGIWDKSNNTKDGFCINSGNQIHMRFFNNLLGVSDDATMEEKKAAYIAYLKKEYEKGTPYEIVYQSLEPEFIPLPQSEQNAIRALKTYYPTTVITVDGGGLDPDIKVTYTADTKNYIDNKFGKTINAMQTKLLELESRV